MRSGGVGRVGWWERAFCRRCLVKSKKKNEDIIFLK